MRESMFRRRFLLIVMEIFSFIRGVLEESCLNTYRKVGEVSYLEKFLPDELAVEGDVDELFFYVCEITEQPKEVDAEFWLLQFLHFLLEGLKLRDEAGLEGLVALGKVMEVFKQLVSEEGELALEVLHLCLGTVEMMGDVEQDISDVLEALADHEIGQDMGDVADARILEDLGGDKSLKDDLGTEVVE